MGTIRHTGRPWRRLRAQILAASDTCGICGHHGADTVDLIIPISLGGDPLDPANLRPAHGVNGCPWCPPNPSRDRRRRGQPRRCNQARGARLTLPQTRRSRAW